MVRLLSSSKKDVSVHLFLFDGPSMFEWSLRKHCPSAINLFSGTPKSRMDVGTFARSGQSSPDGSISMIYWDSHENSHFSDFAMEGDYCLLYKKNLILLENIKESARMKGVSLNMLEGDREEDLAISFLSRFNQEMEMERWQELERRKTTISETEEVLFRQDGIRMAVGS